MISSIRGSSAAIRRGVNAWLTRRRRGPCLGGSMPPKVPGPIRSASSSGTGKTGEKSEEKICGFVETVL